MFDAYARAHADILRLFYAIAVVVAAITRCCLRARCHGYYVIDFPSDAA